MKIRYFSSNSRLEDAWVNFHLVGFAWRPEFTLYPADLRRLAFFQARLFAPSILTATF